MEIKTKFKVGDKVCFHYHYEIIEWMQLRIDKEWISDKDEFWYIKEVYIKAKQFNRLDERRKYDINIPKYYVVTKYIISYKLENWEIYQEDYF